MDFSVSLKTRLCRISALGDTMGAWERSIVAGICTIYGNWSRRMSHAESKSNICYEPDWISGMIEIGQDPL